MKTLAFIFTALAVTLLCGGPAHAFTRADVPAECIEPIICIEQTINWDKGVLNPGFTSCKQIGTIRNMNGDGLDEAIPCHSEYDFVQNCTCDNGVKFGAKKHSKF